jgi:hypothetical protein
LENEPKVSSTFQAIEAARHFPEEDSANAHAKAYPKWVEEFNHFFKERFGRE